MISGPATIPNQGTQRGNILVVDDDPAIAKLLHRVLAAEGYSVESAADGEEALGAIALRRPDVILLDVGLPKLNGFEVCRRVKEDPATCLIPIVIVTGLDDRQHRITGIDAGADDLLSKPFDKEELRARVRSLLRIKRVTDELESAESVIMSLAMTVEARDAYTDGHCHRLSQYATALGRAVGLSGDDLAALDRGGYLHDVGKVGVPDAVLLKPGKLTPGEYDTMKRHTVIGETLCGNLRSLTAVRAIVRSHHERLDGSGYPDGLRGDEVPLLAQVVGIVDEFDAMTTARPYRAALPMPRVLEELATDVGNGKLNAAFTDVFLDLVRRGTFPSTEGGTPLTD